MYEQVLYPLYRSKIDLENFFYFKNSLGPSESNELENNSFL